MGEIEESLLAVKATKFNAVGRTAIDSDSPWRSSLQQLRRNRAAMIALVVGIAPCVPGFLGTIGAMAVAPIWITMYHYAWFISFALSAISASSDSRSSASSQML